MCWMCDHPEATTEDYQREVQATIEQYGWFIQSVGRDRLRPAFAYTIGLSEHDLAELVVVGLPHLVAGGLLNSVAAQLVSRGGRLIPGTRFGHGDYPMIEVVELSAPAVHLVFAAALYGSAICAQQLVYADDRGRWPWEIGFRGKQAVLGPLTDQ